MTVGELRWKAQRLLAERGVPEPRANAEFILAHVLGCKRTEALVRAAEALDAARQRRVWRLVHARARRIPLAYVLGNQDFLGLELEVSPAVLVPRPETEELALAAGRAARRARRSEGVVHILDVGTGSGCVAIALARLLPEARIVATDLSPAALRLARKNARRHRVARRVRFVKADLFQSVRRMCPPGWADLVVSNPPYIPSGELRALEPEVLREPRLALDGGPDGLRAVRALVSRAATVLRPGGCLALEIGHGQEAPVRRLLAASGYRDIQIQRDAQGAPRIVVSRWPSLKAAGGRRSASSR